jgi:hypothetical protein
MSGCVTIIHHNQLAKESHGRRTRTSGRSSGEGTKVQAALGVSEVLKHDGTLHPAKPAANMQQSKVAYDDISEYGAR